MIAPACAGLILPADYSSSRPLDLYAYPADGDWRLPDVGPGRRGAVPDARTRNESGEDLRMPTRTFHDRRGDSWLVWQVLPGDQLEAHGGAGALVPAEMAKGWLTFESGSGSEKRRVYPIPPRWMEYSDDELGALCRMAPPLWTECESAVT